jgi:phosphoribosylformylglycinamidine synthase
MWQFQECVEGLAEACRALDVPVVSGNVSFYNETATGDGKSAAVDPTPTVAMVGVLNEPAKHASPWFKDEGDAVYLLGETREELGGSEYLFTLHRKKAGKPPALDLVFEKRLQGLVCTAVAEEILESAQDCSEGGLAVALAECCFHPEGPRGADVELKSGGIRRDALLFGESASRIVVTVGASHEPSLQEMARVHDVPCTRLGAVGGEKLRVAVDGETVLDEAAAALHKAWSEGFEQAVFGKVE